MILVRKIISIILRILSIIEINLGIIIDEFMMNKI